MDKKGIIKGVCINSVILFVLFMSAIKQEGEELKPNSVAVETEKRGVMEAELQPLVHHQAEEREERPPLHTESPSEEAKYFLHVVKGGETLELLAKAHKTSIENLLHINRLQKTEIKEGQTLQVPKPLKDKDYYVVESGDNPWIIAKRHSVPVDTLLKLNGLNKEKAKKIRPGDRLKVR